MLDRKIQKNYILNVCYQILTIVTPLITAPYVSRALGVEQIGRISYASSIVVYFTLFATLGTSIYGQREISYCQKDRKRRTEIFWNIEAIAITTSILSLFAYFFGVVNTSEDKVLFIVLSFNILNVLFDITWLYQGLEDFATIFLRNVIIKVLSVVSIFIFVKNERDLIVYALIQTGLLITGSFSLWFRLGTCIDDPRNVQINPRQHIPGLILLFIPTIATTFYHQLDKTMIGAMTATSVENGYYEQALKISKMALALVTSFSAVMLPRIGSYVQDHQDEKIKQSLYESYRFVSFLGFPLCFGLIGISSNLIPWFLGSGFKGAIRVLIVLSFHNIIIAYSNVTGMQLLVPTGRQNMLSISVFIGAGVNAFLNWILIPQYYAVGAAIASVFSELTVTIVQLITVRKYISFRKIIIGTSKYFWGALVMLIPLAVEGRYFSSSIINTLIMICTGMITYCVALLIMKDKLIRDVWKNAIEIIRKQKT